MNETEKLFLRELAKRTERVERERPSLLVSAAIRRQRKYGPDFSRRDWFGPSDENRRQRITRAMQSLIAKKLITTRVAGQRRTSNIRITDAGRLAVSQLNEKSNAENH
ncbi:hypothetical protein NHH03_06935 [Stieleria sp. TO1_6]|uniref:hypothetical protein n=1 Tax=Stieleria tagensis TaxID=2956795 RepID=UPI00209B2230|nr:hypothetical protein [Stieleria tagensis]MCO8121466.1 hypothetical protein [Stieleria tagensis]